MLWLLTWSRKYIIDTDPELFFQSTMGYANEIPDNKISHLKKKVKKVKKNVRNICDT